MNHLIYVGFVKKTHGFKGAVKIDIEHPDFIPDPKEPLLLEINRKVVPFFIEEISGNPPEYTIKFEDINNPDEASEISGLRVFTETTLLDDNPTVDPGIEGYSVIDEQFGNIGVVKAYIPKSGQDLLEVSHEGHTYYIPVVEAFFRKVDPKKRILRTTLPEGLIQINQ